MAFDLDRYLKRVGLPQKPEVSSEGLLALHNAQVFSIPFENLDVVLDRGVRLDEESLQEKMIAKQRGGYCFELNGLFALALQSAGFEVRPLLARVLYGRTEPGPRTHEILLVTIGGEEWLADVGFGGPGLRSTIRFESELIQTQFGESYRLRSLGNEHFMLEKLQPEGWFTLYQFDLDPVYPVDLEMSNHYTATHPQSAFRLGIRCTLPNPRGRVTLNNWEFSKHHEGIVTTETHSAATLPALLEEHFHITLDADPSLIRI